MVDYFKKLKVNDVADIIVAGGGPAGVAASISASRQGKKVILLEQSGVLGGSSVLAMVAELMNFDDGINFISNGIGKEIFTKLGLEIKTKREWFNIRYEDIKRVYDELVIESGVEVLFYTKLIDVVCENGTITHVVVSGPDGVSAIQAKFFIDCTGNGSLSVFAGAQYLYGDENGKVMSSTLCSLWGGVDFAKKEGHYDSSRYEEAYRDGVFSQYDSVLPGIKKNYPEINVGGGNVGHVFGVDDRDVKSLTKAMFDGRKILAEYEKYYKNYVAGCENAVLITSANYIGTRESRRIICEYMLTIDSFYKKDSFEDEIGRYSYPIDIHPMTPDKNGMTEFTQSISMRHGDGETYSIPYGCLVPKGVNNLLVAGRCIGADRGMQASTRVIPCCYITGQATGIAAAVCVEENTCARDANVKKVQKLINSL